jgi:isopentenyl phosphate kinase
MQIVKLGGSLITDKKSIEGSDELPMKSFRDDHAESVANEFEDINDELILVNGAGSYGHPKAQKYGLHKGYEGSCEQKQGVAEVLMDVRELNLKLTKILAEHGLFCVSIPPNVTITKNGDSIASIDIDQYRRYLEQGLVPISFGDLVPDANSGISICSGDLIMFELAKAFKPDRAIFVTDVNGVFDKHPSKDDAKLIPAMNNETYRSLEESIEKDEDGGADVTGGILKKAKIGLEIKKMGVECIILNGLAEGRLSDALRGEKVVGTYFER